MPDTATSRLTLVRAPLRDEPMRETGDDIDLLTFFETIWRGKWTILAWALLVLILGGYFVYGIAVPKYSARAILALNVQNAKVYSFDSVMSGVSAEDEAINTELAVIRSHPLINQLVTSMDLMQDPEFNPAIRHRPMFSPGRIVDFLRGQDRTQSADNTRIEVIKAVTKAITVSSEPMTYAYYIDASSEDPAKSATMVNALAKIYLDNQVDVKFRETKFAVDWLSDHVSSLEVEFKQKEDDIARLRAATNLVSAEALEATGIRAKDIRERLRETQAQAADAQQRADALQSAVEQADIEAILAASQDLVLQRLASAARQDQKEAFIARARMLVQAASDAAARLEAQRQALAASYTLIEKQIQAQNADLLRLTQLIREADATRLLYETFLARLKETSVQVGLLKADSRILSEAIRGEQVQPKKPLILMLSILLGMAIGGGIVVLRQFSNGAIRTVEDLEQMTGRRVVGQIPLLANRTRTKLIEFLITHPTSAFVEAMRNLRTSILLADQSNPPKVIMMTSSVPGEGKTTQSIALAHNFASLGNRVLLVEGDVRRSAFRNYFDTAHSDNLETVVLGGVPLEKAVLHVTQLGVDVLLAGRSTQNAADLFTANKFRAFVENARAAYDLVIIDTAPILALTDARLIGQNVDSIVYVVKWDSTGKAQIVEGLRQLSSVGLQVSGIVMTQIDPRGLKRYGYDRRYGSYSSYGSEYYS